VAKKIVVLGAGRSAGYLIQRLARAAADSDWRLTIGDMSLEAARNALADAGPASIRRVDATSEPELTSIIEGADVVVTMLSPRFQAAVARNCVEAGAHMVSVSYLSRETLELDEWARDKGVMLLGEMGLDPGIDHMMAGDAVRRTLADGGRILSFRSFGSGVPAPDTVSNPLRYLVTWNPWNVAMAGAAGAQYLLDGNIRVVPHDRIFLHTWPVEVEGVGTLEAYPNRDSMGYLDHFGIDGVRTMIRGTLRWPGFCETWDRVVALGLANDSVHIPDLGSRSPREVVGMFLPIPVPLERVEAAATLHLGLNPTGRIIQNLRFLGLFDDRPCGARGETAAAMLAHLVSEKLAPQRGAVDMVILVHQMDVEYPERDEPCQRQTYTMVETGDPSTMSAMTRTVGLPTAVAVEMMLRGELLLPGCQLPSHADIGDPIYAELKREGLRFTETFEPVLCGTAVTDR
jgi:saccharopine dehydrogenase-like NADP-dependent oxidoreductase